MFASMLRSMLVPSTRRDRCVSFRRTAAILGVACISSFASVTAAEPDASSQTASASTSSTSDETEGSSKREEDDDASDEPLSESEMQSLLETIDARQQSASDFKARIYMDEREEKGSGMTYEAVVYRRDEADKMVILFTEPKSERGKGYLRIDDNLFLYDPNVGTWERRTERERIGGTGSRRRDFDGSNFADTYDPSYVGRDELGQYETHHLKLEAEDRSDVAHPLLETWIDVESGNLLKLQEFALSGRLMRTTYYPKWQKVRDEKSGDDVYFPKEIRVYDEVEEGNRTIVLFRSVTLKSLPDSIFTKAWVESKSR